MEYPRAVRLQLRLGTGPGHRLAKRRDGVLAGVIGEIVGGSHAAGEQRTGQLGDRLVKRHGGEIDRLGQALALWAVVNQAPNPARLAVASGVIEAHLVVTDDAVVKIGNVQRTVGAELQIDRPEPWVAGANQVRQLGAFRAAAAPLDPVAIDAAGDDVADEDVVAEFRRPVIVLVENDAAQAA